MRYFLAFLVVFGLIIVLFLLLFHSGGSKPRIVKTLDSYATTDAVARLTIDGPIVADQNHQAVQITVGNDEVTFEQIQGYQGTVVNQQTYVNNESAYANFLFALEHAGFTRGNSNNANLKDERGYCPLGDRYVFELKQQDQELERYWSTSCGSPKTYLGSVSLTLDLFQAQVPGYSNLVQKLTF